jgi:hypothetical protein
LPPADAPPDDDLARASFLEQGPVDGDTVVERGRIGVIGRHAVVDRPGAHPDPLGGGGSRRAAAVAASGEQRTAVDVEVDPRIVPVRIRRGDRVDAGLVHAEVSDLCSVDVPARHVAQQDLLVRRGQRTPAGEVVGRGIVG